MAGVRYPFVANARVQVLQLLRRLERHDSIFRDDEKSRNANCGRQLPIVWIGRRQNLEGAQLRLQSSLDDELDEFGRAMRVAKPRRGERITSG